MEARESLTVIAVTVDPACGADERTLAFWCAAIDAQAQEFAAAWSVPYTPVVFYSSDVLTKLGDGPELDKFVADSRLLTIQPSLDVQGALGYHDDIAGVIFARVMWQGDATSVTISHEALEEMGDPTCDQYEDMGNGKAQALEACDRVEGDVYAQAGIIDTDSLDVQVSNYLLAAAFSPGSSGPWDRLGKLTAWDGMTEGGYMIVRDANGNETQVFARADAGRINLARKLEKPRGRLARRLRGRWAP